MKFKLACVLLSLVTLCSLIFGCNSTEKHSIDFIVDGKSVETVKVDSGDKLTKPEIKQRENFTFKGWYLTDKYEHKWDFNCEVNYSFNLYGYYVHKSQETFNVIFKDDETELRIEKVLKGEKCPDFLPEKVGYKFCGWLLNGEVFDTNYEIDDDLVLCAKWELVEYTATFLGENFIEKRKFTVENYAFTPPYAPAKEHYTVQWESYELSAKDITINALYKPITYTAEFVADNTTVQTINYTVEDTPSIPEVPKKDGYTAKWVGLPLNCTNSIIYAKYEPITYTITFIIDGKTVGTANYTVEDKNFIYPEIPEKEGFSGYWQEKELTYGDITISAFYEID